jgi:hypothetical protein
MPPIDDRYDAAAAQRGLCELCVTAAGLLSLAVDRASEIALRAWRPASRKARPAAGGEVAAAMSDTDRDGADPGPAGYAQVVFSGGSSSSSGSGYSSFVLV